MIIVRKPSDRPLRRNRVRKALEYLESIQVLKEPVFKTNRLTGQKYYYVNL